jgi:hypothetical protein
MVRSNRIKEYRFSETISASSTGSFVSSQPVNGEILEVDLIYGSQGVGSAFLTTSNGTEFWRTDAASGATTQHFYPRVLTQLSTGSISVAAGARPDKYVSNEHIVLNTKAILSGAAPFEVTVRYR